MAGRKDSPVRATRSRPGREETIHADAVRAALQTILASAPFYNAARLRRFLEFIVEWTLRGEGSQLKEYVIALGVFHRPATFEPHLDSVVRVEARRLRAKLADYYAGEGKQARVVIELPKGSYRPVFRHAEHTSLADRVWKMRRGVRLPWVAALLGAAGLALVAIVVAIAMRPRVAALSQIDSLVVLPFRSEGLISEFRYFGDGLPEMMIEALSNLKGLRVIAAASALRAGRGPESAAEKARRLHVAAALEGTLSQRGNSLRINVSLIGADGQYLWSGTYDRPAAEVTGSHRDIVRDVVRALRLNPAVEGAAGRIAEPKAEQAYLIGRFLWNKRDPESVRKSVAYFEEAIGADPGYAQPHAALAASYAVMAFNDQGPPEEMAERARKAALKAIEIDPQMAEAHGVLAWVRFFHDRDWAAAESGFQRTLAVNANSASALQWYGLTRIALSRFADAAKAFEAARRLDPLSMIIRTDAGVALYYARHYGSAASRAREVIGIDPAFFWAHALLGAVETERGNPDAAIAELERAVSLAIDDTDCIMRLAVACARSGKRARALDLRARLLEVVKTHPRGSYQLACVEAAIGERGAAFEWLQQALRDHEAAIVFLNVDPLMDSLRGDPRFREVSRALNLPRS